jgi:hypothetical protein
MPGREAVPDDHDALGEQGDKGTVCSTALGSQLRAWPVPVWFFGDVTGHLDGTPAGIASDELRGWGRHAGGPWPGPGPAGSVTAITRNHAEAEHSGPQAAAHRSASGSLPYAAGRSLGRRASPDSLTPVRDSGLISNSGPVRNLRPGSEFTSRERIRTTIVS